MKDYDRPVSPRRQETRAALGLCFRFLSVAVLLGTCALVSNAQTREKRFSIGGMVGKSAGVTVKYYARPAESDQARLSSSAVGVDLSITDDDDYLWTAQAMIQRSIPSSPLNLYLGPGAVVGARDADLVWGVSSIVGVFFEKARFEVFIQLTPRIILLPDLHGEFGSAVGLRYYL